MIRIESISDRMSWGELTAGIREKTRLHGKDSRRAVVVFKQSAFSKPYPVESRSYLFRCDDNRFLPQQISTSLHGISLDGKDRIRIDWYLPYWEIDYCYFCKEIGE